MRTKITTWLLNAPCAAVCTSRLVRRCGAPRKALDSGLARHTRRAHRLLAALLLAAAGAAGAHDFDLGSLRIDHPYGLPAAAGDDTRVFFRTLKNFSRISGAIVAASSPSCDRVVVVGPAGEGSRLPIPGRASTRYRHDQPAHLACLHLRQTLAAGQEFPMTLDFGAAGRIDITVYVQQPRLSW